MTIVVGAGVGYSPLLYRKRDEWASIAEFLRKDAIQPNSAGSENDEVLGDYDRRISHGFAAIERVLAEGALDALILITADRGSQFDDSHVPQIHLQVGGEIWGDPAIRALGESPRRFRFECNDPIAAVLIEELVRDGFDVAEAKGAFEPIGDPEQGLTPAAAEAVARLGAGLPIIPISINCHVTDRKSVV